MKYFFNKTTIYTMSLFYINVGVKHFIDPDWFLFIIPPYLTFIGLELVYLSGIFEITLGILILFSLHSLAKSPISNLLQYK